MSHIQIPDKRPVEVYPQTLWNVRLLLFDIALHRVLSYYPPFASIDYMLRIGAFRFSVRTQNEIQQASSRS